MLSNITILGQNDVPKNHIKSTLENGKVLQIENVKNIKIKNIENGFFEINFIRGNEKEYVTIQNLKNIEYHMDNNNVIITSFESVFKEEYVDIGGILL